MLYLLKNVNEKFAIKKFADGLRNRRLSTVIAARNYKSLKDAIQAAKEEETEGSSTSGDVMGMYQNNYEPHLFSTRGRNHLVTSFIYLIRCLVRHMEL